MSQLSKQDLKAENQLSFPNNNNGAITPADLRAFNVDMIDSTVNQTSFDSFSGSVAGEFASLTASVDPSITGSSLVTASFDNGTRNLTFTKGDASTFAVNIPDASGSVLPAGVVSGSSQINIYDTENFATFNDAIQSDIGQKLFTSSFNAYTASQSTGSLLLTASVSGQTMTFTKADGTTFNVSLPAGSGSLVDTGSFATTGSNSFNGNQNITGSAQISGQLIFGTSSLGPTIQTLSGNGLQVNAGESGSFSMRTLYGAGVGDAIIEAYDTFPSFNTGGKVSTKSGGGVDILGYGGQVAITGSSLLMQGFTYPTTDGTNGQVLTTNGGKVLSFTTVSGGGIDTGSFATTGSNFFVGIQSINEVPGTAVGEVYLLGRSGSLFIANQLSAGGGPSYASISHISSSQVNANTNLIFKDNSFAGSTIVSGSGNIFSNPTAAAANRVNYIGGNTNLFLNGQADQLPTITGSAASVSGNRPVMNSNIIAGIQNWTINQAANPGSHTYSNNILSGIGTWTFNMTGNTGTVNVNNNLGLTSNLTINSPSRSIAQINAGESGSTTLQIQNNIIQGGINYQGPVSASLHQFQQNSIAGTLNLNVQSASRAIQMNGNIINGTMTMNDNTVFAPTLGSSISISNNNINGNITLTNRASASFTIAGNTLNGFTITNDYDSSTNGTTGRIFVLQGNTIAGFIGNNIYFSGSANGTGTTNDRGRGLYGNLLGGSRISASVIGDGNRSLIASAIVGHGLNIYGTSLYDASNAANAGGQNGGSAFFGRWNAEDGNRALSAETILAVGTGTSGSTGITRKTGFLIDSGSNTFIEGTLNVSGSTTITGSLSVTNLIVSGSTQFNGAQYSSLVTQSGSANVSQSITFDTTGPEFGVSLVDNTKLTVANSGTYNIQFSAQLLADTGADNVYIWFKKNGTNIAGSASELAVSNNDEALMTVNILDTAVANDYYELCWQTTNGDAVLLTAGATGNIPSIPSVIATITQVR